MRTLRYAAAALALSVTVGLGGCGESSESDESTVEDTMSETPSSDPSSSEQPSETASDSSSSMPSGASAMAQASVADLAGRLDIDKSEIDVLHVEDVTWRDGSIGCAKPGSMYTQALVDGQRIVLSAGGQEYEYHAGGPRAPFLCESPTQ